MTVVEFEVIGDPSSQGSKTRMPNGAMLDGKDAKARAKHRSWRSAVAQAAKDIADTHGQFPDGPLRVDITFRFPMPKSRPKWVRERGWAYKTSAPDVDKSERSTNDALTNSGLIIDDSRIAEHPTRKLEVTGWTGAIIRIESINDPKPLT